MKQYSLRLTAINVSGRGRKKNMIQVNANVRDPITQAHTCAGRQVGRGLTQRAVRPLLLRVVDATCSYCTTTHCAIRATRRAGRVV